MDLDLFAAALGVTVVEAETHDGNWGEYIDALRLIVITPGLGRAQYRSTLAHELGHAFYRHTATLPIWERQADLFAASILVTVDEVDNAAHFAPTIDGIAAELGVLPWVIQTHYKARQGHNPK